MALINQTRYPNQKQITVRKLPVHEGDIYLKVRKDALCRAAKNLDAGPFKLYIYIASNQEGYRFNLSPAAIEEYFGMGLKQYRNAVGKLKVSGYLFQPDPTKENYIFLEDGDRTFDENEDANAAIYPKRIDPKKIDTKGIDSLSKKDAASYQNGQNLVPKGIEKYNNITTITEDNRDARRQAFQAYKEMQS